MATISCKNAGHFERNVHTTEVLIDRDAVPITAAGAAPTAAFLPVVGVIHSV
jgi:hypothetical protein